MIRVSSTVRSELHGVEAGGDDGTIAGAKTSDDHGEDERARRASGSSTVETTRQARVVLVVASRPATTGISADDSAPAATSWKIRSGSRNAAKKASSSGPGTERVAMTTTRTQPRMRETRNAPETIERPARAEGRDDVGSTPDRGRQVGRRGRSARGWASRYAAAQPAGETWV